MALVGCGTSERQVGDGFLLDEGFLSYWPRFRIEMPTVRVGGAVVQDFEIIECPNADYSLQLHVRSLDREFVTPEEWGRFWIEMREVGVHVSVLLEPLGSRQTFAFQGLLTEDWGAGAFKRERFFQTETLQLLPLDGTVRLRVSVSLDDPRELEQQLDVQVVLVGAGIIV